MSKTPKPLSFGTTPDNAHVPNILAEATQNGTVADAHTDDLERAELVLAGGPPDGNLGYVVAEVSVTVDQRDINRAQQHAAILQQATSPSPLFSIPRTMKLHFHSFFEFASGGAPLGASLAAGFSQEHFKDPDHRLGNPFHNRRATLR